MNKDNTPDTIEDEVPTDTVKEWISQCSCCPECSQVPCDGVMAGGFCDDLCECVD